MSYRDDLDAAHARISSLEAELATERETARVAREQLDTERKERRRLEQIVGAETPKPIEDSGLAIFKLVAAILIAAAALSIYWFLRR